MTCRITRFQDGGPFHLNPLVTTCRLKSSSSYERIKNIQVTVLLSNQKTRKRYTLILQELLIYKHYTEKIGQHEPHKKTGGDLKFSGRVGSS